MKQVTQLIAKYLTLKPTSVADITCAICGSHGDGFRTKEVLSSNFTGWHYLKHGKEHICQYCQACLDSKALDGKALRNYSFIATENELNVLQHAEIAWHVMNPPVPPFVFVVTYTHKKHAFLNARLNDNREQIRIGLEEMYITFVRQVFIHIYHHARTLYEAGFSKEEIRTGTYRKWKLLEQMGEGFWGINRSLEIYRGTPFFNFLIHILQKGDTND